MPLAFSVAGRRCRRRGTSGTTVADVQVLGCTGQWGMHRCRSSPDRERSSGFGGAPPGLLCRWKQLDTAVSRCETHHIEDKGELQVQKGWLKDFLNVTDPLPVLSLNLASACGHGCRNPLDGGVLP